MPGPPRWFAADSFDRAEVEFWPRLGEAGEPDLRIELAEGASHRHTVLVEIKLYSPKSQKRGDEDILNDADEPPLLEKDQLARYWKEQHFRLAGKNAVTIIYLTAHATAPARDLKESLRPGMDLAWLSWRDVWAVAKNAHEHLPARDLANLLHSKALACFDGFSHKTVIASANGSFWRGPTAFGRQAIVLFARTLAHSPKKPATWAPGRFFSKESHV